MNDKKETILPYDRTLQTAHTPELTSEAENLIKKIESAQELFKATNGPDRFLQTKYPTATQLLYAQIAEQNEFLTRQLAATEAAVKQLEDTTRATRRLAEELRTRQTGIHQTINRELDKIKNIVRLTDLAAKKEDGIPTTVTITLEPEALFSLPPSDTGSKLPAKCRDLVRPLSVREKEIRKKNKCHKCQQFGHWATNHCSYTCRTCGRIAPGHATGTRWCPNFASTSKEEDTSEPEYFDANEYDDWFGEEGEHNLAT